MPRWMILAFLSMLFAGVTSVIAKHGLEGITGELGLTVRTCFVFAFVLAYAAWDVPGEQFATLSKQNYVWLGLSGLTTAISWVFYYQALKAGEVSTVALIDKGSFIIAVLLAWFFLREQITLRTGLGSLLILAGLLVVAKK